MTYSMVASRGVDDVSYLDATIIFYEAQRLLSQDVMLHREAFSKSQAELNRCEADLKRFTEERDALKLLYVQKEEEIRDLRVELARAHKEQADLIEQILQVQQKAEKIEQLHKEAKVKETETLGRKQSMDRLVSKRDAARAQLSSVERQL
ncbi:uncharacterized protein [Nicotiana tomentosiformis]|uniref:uncharacterized protein n=1 Tax=Nicotiana tomentosiformis TaxID=4098 RepID=UPI00388CC47D